MTSASLQGLGAHGGHSIQSISGGWSSLGKEEERFGTNGSERREGREGSRGDGRCSVVMAGLNTLSLLRSRIGSRTLLKPLRGKGGFKKLSIACLGPRSIAFAQGRGPVDLGVRTQSTKGKGLQQIGLFLALLLGVEVEGPVGIMKMP